MDINKCANDHAQQVAAGSRFEFGANWKRFLELLDDERIRMAENSLCTMLKVDGLKGKKFLDIGSGSGLFSLAARRLGASVYSFDYDPQSVACTAELKQRYYNNDKKWIVEEGSALDPEYLAKLGQFDVVYSWGVLHHTGRMWNALGLLKPLMEKEGMLFIALYNDQGFLTQYWIIVKKIYNRSVVGKYLMVILHMPYLFVLRWLYRKIFGKSLDRGMDLWRDMFDWLGGYPMEVAKPETVFDYFSVKGFSLHSLKTCGGRMGCNEFVFKKKS